VLVNFDRAILTVVALFVGGRAVSGGGMKSNYPNGRVVEEQVRLFRYPSNRNAWLPFLSVQSAKLASSSC
jgi:hypothetical protein